MKKYWRWFIAILFLIAFTAPWLQIDYEGIGAVNGFQTTLFIGAGLVISNPRDFIDVWSLLLALVVIGLVCTLFYLLLNLVPNFDWARQRLSSWRKGTLIGAVLGMLGSIIFTIFSLDSYFKIFGWGYWLAWGGVVSSIGLEVMEIQSSKQHIVDQ